MQLITLTVGCVFTNCYLLANDEGEALVIDPGGDPEVIIDSVRSNAWRVRYILATHAHFDHVGGMKALQEKMGGESLLHRGDLPLLENLPAQGAAFGLKTGPVPPIDRFVEEGDLLSLGGAEFRVIHTPGHSPGGITLLGDKMAFVGDTLFAGSIGRTDLPGGSYEILLDSIERKLCPLEADTVVYPGHGEATTMGREKRYNPFLAGEAP